MIGQEAGLQVHLDGQFRTTITMTFTGPLESGIRRLTRGHSSSFAYGPPPHPGRTGPLTEIWIIESAATVGPAVPVDLRARAARLAHLGSLSQRRDDGAVAELSGILAEDPDPVVRTRAALALSRPGDPRATPALTAALGDRHPSVRIQAVRGLRRVESERAAEALGRVLRSDADPSVRRAAVSVLASLRDAAAGSALGAAMSADSDASVRQAAAAAYHRWEQAVRTQPSR
jgi:HEAT repeat protein